MLFLLCLGILATSLWSIARTGKAIRRKPRRAGWWITFAFFAMAGAGFAIWCLFFVTKGWQISSNIKFIGIPVPAATFVFEAEGWTDFVPPEPMRSFIVLTDVLACVAFALLPFKLAVSVGGKRQR